MEGLCGIAMYNIGKAFYNFRSPNAVKEEPKAEGSGEKKDK